MRPKTKIQIAVYNLSKELPKLTESQKDYAVSKFFLKLSYSTKNKAFCLECGSDIDINSVNRKRVTCLNCHHKLKVQYTRKIKESTGSFFFAVASLVKNELYDFQVVRTFEMKRYYRKGEEASLYCSEVCQNWYNIDGKEVTISKLIGGFNGSYQGDLEIRDTRGYKDYSSTPDLYCPTSKFRDEYVKKGINHKMINVSLKTAVTESSYPQMETLLKIGYHEVFASWRYYTVIKYWDSLKICFRNKYKIKKPSIYKDLLDALQYLNKDMRNAHYVCPKNLKKAHDYYIQKMNEVKIGKTIAQNMKKAKEANPKYIIEKSKFFELEFSNGPIKIVPLKSVPEFLAEGEFLNHCVFRSSYYADKDSLILSARIKNKPIETIEVSLKDFKVLQCYGKNNKKSKHHEEILKLINGNIPKIKQIINKSVPKIKKLESA